jgi:SecD/SecF fusion protein
MQRNFVRGLLICLIPCLVAALFAARLDRYKLGIDLAGGTILVYEVNLERTKQRAEALGRDAVDTAQGLGGDKMAKLAAEIKRRIDPTDILNITVRPLGGSRLEVILPIGTDVEESKRRISQMGVLEFRILANGPDDFAGIEAARAALDSKSPEEVREQGNKGLAPESPVGDFVVNINDTAEKVRYVWSELGPEERDALGLTNADEKPSEDRLRELAKAGTVGNWAYAAARRGKTFTTRGNVASDDNATATRVLFSREVTSHDQLAKEEAERQRLLREGKSPAEAEALVAPKKVEYFVLTRVSPLDSLRVEGDVTLTANVGSKGGDPAVDFSFNSAGAQLFGKMTRRNKPSKDHTRLLAVLLDDKVQSAATIQSEITTQGQITGRFDRKTVERQVYILRSGALSAELRDRAVSENTIGPTLGQDTIRKGTLAVGLAFVAILAFMVFYYRFAGLVACVALFANLLLTVGFMVAVNAAFTLPGLAGLVLTLGMAVDANVLIYERLREERNKGANIATAIRNGYDRAFLTIIDTHLTSIFTAVVLYTLGNDQLKGFAITLTVGLVISLFTSLYMTRLIFDYWQHRRWLTDLRMMRLFSRPNLKPMKYRFVFLPVTAALTVAGLALFLYRGEEGLNVDFRGGTVFAGKLKEDEARALTKTSDGKLGFRELLSEPRQAERLNATSAQWENAPTARAEDGKRTADEILAAGSYVYTIRYADGGAATVTLTAAPAGAAAGDEAAMAADVVERARHLPDVSVEQMFLSGESRPPEGKSRLFTIRTTEKQPDLVRVALDRLLQEDGKPLMAGATVGVEVAGPKATLTFSQPTSLAFVRDLLDREFKKAVAGVGGQLFVLSPVGDPVDGRYAKMAVDVGQNPALAGLGGAAPDAKEAETFRGVLDAVKRGFESAPEPLRLEVFDSTLAAETRDNAFRAILMSWVVILLYLWFRFHNWTFGLAAVLCLVHDLCFTLGAIAVCHYLHLLPGASVLGLEDFKIDLAAVAALLTLVGYSVNEIIVNFARIREVRGKDPRLTPQMIDDSVNQTLSRTILTSMTVLLVSLVLYIFGGEGVHLFAFVMVVGVLISTYSSIFVASPLLLFLGEGRDAAGAADEPAAKEEGAEEEVVEG